MIRIGVDFGGTKIEAAALDVEGRIVARVRKPNPGGYDSAVETVAEVVEEVERQAGASGSIGLGIPGSLSSLDGTVRNANSTWMNGRPFKQDVEARLGRPVRVANDANCMALSEACDGAGAGAGVVFAAILGTGCGGGVVVDGRIIEGRNGIGGEWGHTPLPWLNEAEWPGRRCWCGRMNCLEQWISGVAFCRSFADLTGEALAGAEIVAAARAGKTQAVHALEAYVDRLGRALAVIADILDPDVMVLAGGMSNTTELYEMTPPVTARHAFSDRFTTPIVQARHGDSSGVRGAAWLWPLAT
jgi:fructokinase